MTNKKHRSFLFRESVNCHEIILALTFDVDKPAVTVLYDIPDTFVPGLHLRESS
ncbi:hypothetical protein [Paenibacillus sp. P32E]|uniref:hypothetical protein n=1 Tax=Paenibacillus sp. P32E TaxID=1349434 RepID=UPI0015BB0096|nr:hypothetical protein [Paenibacillus sp. P32E]